MVVAETVSEHKDVVLGTAGHDVVATITSEPVDAGRAAKRIRVTATDDCIGQAITVADETTHTGKRDILDIGPQRIVGEGGVDCIGARVQNCGFSHDIACAIDEIRIVIQTAGHRVVAGSAIEYVVPTEAIKRVIADTADKRVCTRVAGAGEVTGAYEGEIFDICIGDGIGVGRAIDRIDTRTDAREFADHIVADIDEEGIVAEAAIHGVIEQAAVKKVVSGATVQDIDAIATVKGVAATVTSDGVVKRIAGESTVAGGARKNREVFDVVTQRVVQQRSLNRVRTLARSLRHHVADVADGIGVVAQAATHRISADTTTQDVVAAITQ